MLGPNLSNYKIKSTPTEAKLKHKFRQKFSCSMRPFTGTKISILRNREMAEKFEELVGGRPRTSLCVEEGRKGKKAIIDMTMVVRN